MVLSEELLDIKNIEIRVLTEKLRETEELIRTITINYATYLNDYESRWGRYINEFDYVERELYHAKDAYYNLLKQNYESGKQKDEKTELKLKELEAEIAELRKKLENSVTNQEIVDRVLRQPINKQKGIVQQLQWLFNGTNFDKIDKTLVEMITTSIKKLEEEQMRLSHGDNYLDSPLFPFIIDSSKASEVVQLLRQKVACAGQKNSQAFPIRAAMNVGAIKRIPWGAFKKAFPQSTISKTRFNAILNNDVEDNALINHKEEIKILEKQFKAIENRD
jgi:hypothetical protein